LQFRVKFARFNLQFRAQSAIRGVTAPFLRECFDKTAPMGAAVHRRAMEMFRQYLLIGGMPQAVLAYVDHRDFAIADK
jgi:predicted AAA+ superfamily ATPase